MVSLKQVRIRISELAEQNALTIALLVVKRVSG